MGPYRKLGAQIDVRRLYARSEAADMQNFKVGNETFEEMSDAAQEAEFQHPATVVALTDGMFHRAGETVYESKGSPDDE